MPITKLQHCEKNSIIIVVFNSLISVFPLVIIIITVVICTAIIAQRAKVFENRGKFVGELIIRFEARRIFYICELRRIKETHACHVVCVNITRKGIPSLFFFSRARPPCQCVDALNWLVILIEFHYSSARQWTASFNERE